MNELVPPEQAQRIATYHGDQGRAWLRDLPDLVARCVDRWKLILEPAFEPGGEAGWAAPVLRADGTAAVLKLAVPLADVDDQARALRAWAGRGAIRLLAYDEADRALLLERCVPGRDATFLSADQADQVAVGILRGLWPVERPELSAAADLAELCRHRADVMAARAEQFGTTVDVGPFREAARLYRSLPASTVQPGLLHGDFHQRNLLDSERGWLAIDPMPRIGDPGFDVAQFLRHDLGPGSAVRADVLADRLGLDRYRQSAWLFAVGTQAASWYLETGDRARYEACTEALSKVW